MVWWPQHSLQPNLLTHCVLERAKLPQSVLSQLYVRVSADPIVAAPTKAVRPTTRVTHQRLTVPITLPPVDATTSGTGSLVVESGPPAVSDGRITSVDEIMKLGLVTLEKELQRRGLKTGGTRAQH